MNPVGFFIVKNRFMKTRNMLIGLAAFFAAGAVVGALYAPDKGERTRRRLTRKANKLLYKVNDSIEEGKDSLEEIRDRLKDNIEKVDYEIDRLSKC